MWWPAKSVTGFQQEKLELLFPHDFLDLSVCLLKTKRGGWSQLATAPSHGIGRQTRFPASCLDSSELERS